MKLIKNAVCLLIVVAIFSSAAMADGGYIPQRAYPANPTIPTQRALITFRNGVETLVVESTYQSDSPNVGWILPLPAEPSKLEKADSGLLRSISMCLRPRITHDLSRLVMWLVIAAGCMIPFVLVVLLVEDPRRRELLKTFAVMLILTLLLGACLLPSLGVAGVSPHGIVGITEVSSQRVGNYETTVLKATDGGAVSAWLEANSLKGLDAQAKKIVDDYVARKWCFVVARLSKQGNGLATPHPIAATFPSASIVYPMKLTALAGSVTHVELFVACDKQAAAKGFECIAADQFLGPGGRGGAEPANVLSEEDPVSRSPEPYYQAHETRLVIGNPDAGAFLWDGCIVTKLVADMEPQEMGRDVDISRHELTPYRKHVFSPRGRMGTIMLVALGASILLMLSMLIAYRGARRPQRKHLRFFVWPMIGVLAICAGAYLLLPTIDARPVNGRHVLFGGSFVWEMKYSVRDLLSGQMSDEELKRFPTMLKDRIAPEHLVNPFSGREMQFERSPGNFSVRRLDGHTYFCVYDVDCREWRVLLPDGVPETQP